MRIKKEELPVVMEAPGSVIRNYKSFGGMTVGFVEFPAGTDFTPLLQGLANNSCHCPHWGYMLEGEIEMRYDDGTRETIAAGDLFYMQPGHTGVVTRDLKFLDFSPDKELAEVMDHINRKMAELSQ